MICDATRDIADIVLREGDVHPVFGQAISESDGIITTTTVGSESEFVDQTLATLELEERTGMAIMAMRRANDWILSPIGETTLQSDDVFIARGPKEGSRLLREQAID